MRQGSNLEWWVFRLIRALHDSKVFRETALDMASGAAIMTASWSNSIEAAW